MDPKELERIRGEAQKLQKQVGTLAEAEKAGLKITPTTTVEEAEAVVTTDGLRRQAAEAGIKPGEVTSFRSEEEFNKFRERVVPAGERPSRPDLVGQFKTLREEEDVKSLEDSIFSLREERMRLVDEFNRFEERAGGAETLGVARGRVSEEQRAVQKELDVLERRERLATDQLNIKNSTISTIMSFTGQDFANANAEWNTAFSQNLQLQNAFDNQATREETSARTTLTTMQKSIQDAGKTFADLDPSMKAQIQALELQAGLPSGLFEMITNIAPQDKIEAHGTRTDASGNEYYDVLMRDRETGQPYVQSVFRGKGKPSEQEESKSEFALAEAFIATHSDASDAELKASLLRDSNLDVSEINAIIDAREKKALTPEEIKNKIKTTLEAQKGTFSRSEAEIQAETQLKKALGLKDDQELPSAHKKAIKDALVEVYGRTFFQKVLPGGR